MPTRVTLSPQRSSPSRAPWEPDSSNSRGSDICRVGGRTRMGLPPAAGTPPRPVSSRWGQRPPPAHQAAGSRTRFKPLPAALANHTGERPPVCGGRRSGLASEGGPEFGATEAHTGPGRGGAEAGVHTLRPGVPLRQWCWRRETPCQHGTASATRMVARGNLSGHVEKRSGETYRERRKTWLLFEVHKDGKGTDVQMARADRKGV